MTAVRKNVQNTGIDVNDDNIKETWHAVYRSYFLKRALARVHLNKKGFYMYHQGLDSDVSINNPELNECGGVNQPGTLPGIT